MPPLVVIIAWTAYLTVSFVRTVLPNMPGIVSFLSLVVFDGGMLAWLVVFLNYAQGDGQRTTAMGACIFDFVGVGLMALAQIFLGGQTLIEVPANLGEYAVWAIAIWTIVNVGAVIGFHLLSPEAKKSMAIQSEKDAIFNEALEMLKNRRTENSTGIARQISGHMYNAMLAELAADKDGDGIADLTQLPIMAATGASAPKYGFLRLRSPLSLR